MRRIIKSNLPSLESINLNETLVTGSEVFSLDSNLGWEQLKYLNFGLSQSYLNGNYSLIRLKNLCQYGFEKMQRLDIRKFHLTKVAVGLRSYKQNSL